MSSTQLEIHRWYCDLQTCDASATTIGVPGPMYGYPAGWVTTGEEGMFGEMSFCSADHAREHAARRVRVEQQIHSARTFNISELVE